MATAYKGVRVVRAGVLPGQCSRSRRRRVTPRGRALRLGALAPRRLRRVRSSRSLRGRSNLSCVNNLWPGALQAGRRAGYGGSCGAAGGAAAGGGAVLPPTVPPAPSPTLCNLAGGASVERRAQDDAAARGLRLLRRHRVDPVLRPLARLCAGQVDHERDAPTARGGTVGGISGASEALAAACGHGGPPA